MRISDLVKMGLRNLRRRKARTALTVIGVVIGTISIVVMISLGIGLDRCYEQNMKEYGSINTLRIQQNAWIPSEEGEGQDIDQKNLMTDEFVEKVRKIKHVKTVTPVYQTYVRLYGGGWETGASVSAVDFSVLDKLDPPKPVIGSYDLTSGTDQVVLSSAIFEYRYRPNNYKEVTTPFDMEKERVSYLFEDLIYQKETPPDANGEGGFSEQIMPKKERVQNYVYVDDQMNSDFNYYMYMDVQHYKELYERQAKKMPAAQRKEALKKLENYQEVRVIVDNVDHVADVAEKIHDMGAQTDGLSGFIEQIKEQAKMIQLVLGGIGGVAMLVSAISIANTMIMSIYERTKEIGVMKVLGCVVTDIKKLFLLEAGAIGAIGGLIGIGFSYLLSYLVNKYGGTAFGATLGLGMSTGEGSQMQDISQIPVWLSIAALLFAFLVGVVSGYLPARRATRISAIEAMKSEG